MDEHFFTIQHFDSLRPMWLFEGKPAHRQEYDSTGTLEVLPFSASPSGRPLIPGLPRQVSAFDVGNDSYPRYFSPIQIPSSRLFRLLQEWECTLCLRSEQFASFIERKRTNNGTLDIESVIARSRQPKIRFHTWWNCPVVNCSVKLSLTIRILLFHFPRT